MRVLGRLRLSRATEESTSIRRQREIVQQWADANGHDVVGFASDVDVSGSVDPFETPELGPWLRDRPQDFDILAAWKLDRLGRDSIRLNKLFGWCIDHGKTVVSTSEGIDLSTPVGRLIANVIAFLAEGELAMIRERQLSSRAKLRELGRWPGGKPPYGYTASKADDGWKLEIDPVAAAVVRRIVADVIDGKTVGRIATELTSEGLLPPGAYYAAQKGSQGRESVSDQVGKGQILSISGRSEWQPTAIRNMLRSKALRGYVHLRGETIRDADGEPVQLAEPLVTLDEWDLLQAALDDVRAGYLSAHPTESSPLAGVAVCLDCDVPLHHSQNRVKRGERNYTYRHYICRTRKCVAIPAEDLETLAEEAFLYELGDLEVRERVWVQGDSRDADLRDAVSAFDELTKAAERVRSATAKHRLQAQLDALDAKIAALELAPALEARWEYHPTGGTYRDAWDAADTVGRRELLTRSGIQVAAAIHGVVGRRKASNPGAFKFEIRVPDEVRTLGQPPHV